MYVYMYIYIYIYLYIYMYIYINYICICATVNSILPTEIKKGHSGSPPKKVVLSSEARISVSVEA